MSKKLAIGFDFDGVIAYNPFRVIRYPISLVKRKLFKKRKLSFFYPKNEFERFAWMVMHESSFFPATGVELLKSLVTSGQIDAHLVTARYNYLDVQLFKWLRSHRLEKYFKSITWNKHDNQPHLYKEKTINQRKLDYFIEDNLDIVEYLHGKSRTKIYWIYNILDRNHPHPHKHPHLKEALEDIMRQQSADHR